MKSLPKNAAAITSEWIRADLLSLHEFYELLRFRQQIFVVEQGSPYPDLDGLDLAAWHLRLRAEPGALAGYLRLLPPPDAGPAAPVRIGRVAVAASRRRLGLGRRLMTEALDFCRARYPGRTVALAAQAHLAGFYQGLGFVAASAPYDDFGVPHVEMTLDKLAPGAICAYP
jgi:ElaA protein